MISDSAVANLPSERPTVWRQRVVLGLIFVWFSALGFRIVQIQMGEYELLQMQGDRRYLREIKILPERGNILDRNNQVLTVSTPVKSLAADPGLFCQNGNKWGRMVKMIEVSAKELSQLCDKYANSNFMYIKRGLPPPLVQKVIKLEIPGVEIRNEYKRYYPGGPVSAHLVGFTDIDNTGQEGLEKLFDNQLKGKEGNKRVLKALTGHHVESIESIQQVENGEDLVISIDQRVQYLGSSYLEAAVNNFKASGGSIVVLSVPSGEILSMVNSPQFNPNDRGSLTQGVFRNRAVTDTLEPGSTIKPFTIAMGLESGKVGPETMINTKPGKYHIGGHTISDIRNYGEISLFEVIVHSSNVGSAKLALAFPFEYLYETLERIGFGKVASSLPGEVSGTLKKRLRKIEHATLSYGYGLSVTPLQLARAYTVFATDGVLLPVTLEKKEAGYTPKGRRVFSPDTVADVREMLEAVVTPNGTAHKARIPRYRVGGKTGTIHKLINGNYINKRYISLFAGIAPISDPKFVMVVAIDDPQGEFYYGGDVAAPVFSSLMADLLRLYNVKPDSISEKKLRH